MHITFVGGGNMATALISGLARDGASGGKGAPAGRIRVADPSAEARQRLAADFGVGGLATAAEAVAGANVVVLAIKPQVMSAVLDELAGQMEEGQLVVSVAAGIRSGQIRDHLGVDAVIRAMPNTPALLGAGVTGVYASPGCSPEQVEAAERILSAAGATVRIEDEALMDVVTAVSGSGPAYFFALTEALREAAEALGLPAEAANTLAVHTALGAGRMAVDGGADIAELRRRVTSPGGTTQAALETFESGGFRALVLDAVRAATERGRELSGAGDPA